MARVRKLLAIARVPTYRRALLHGCAAAVEHEGVPYRHEFRTVLDVGAGRGQFALVAARRLPGAEILCFEPLAGPRRRLERALARHPRLTVFDTAVSDEAGTADFFVSRADDSSSLLPVTATQLRIFPGTEVVDRLTVRRAPLDGLLAGRALERPLLLKIDVQGAELDVLRGAGGMLREVDSVLVECSFVELYRGQPLAGDVMGHLAGFGFVLTAVCSPVLDGEGRVLQADLLLERS